MNSHFRVSALALAVTAAVTGFSANVAAQEQTADQNIETIQVKGLRASLAKSMNEKRFSAQVVDGISAEDIGKFPDSNVAEALQRVTGVSIDRSGGEGRFVSIRGLGPTFSTVTVNGREIASENENRSFSFDTLAAELVRGVNVYKSSKASQLEGGIGGNVDIRTAQPFDFDGFTAAGSVKANYEENSGETTPNASVLLSNLFMDGKLGVLGSLTYQDRESENYRVANDGIVNNTLAYREHGRPTDGSPKTPTGVVHEDVYFHQAISKQFVNEQRQRLGGNLALQYQASDALRLTLDALYSKLDVDTVNNASGVWLWAPESGELDENRTVVKMVHADEYTGYAFNRIEKHRPSTTAMLGFNADWQITDELHVNLDLSSSKAKNNNKGLDSRQDVAMNKLAGAVFDYTSGSIPSLYLRDPVETSISEANIAKLTPRHQERSGEYVEANNDQLKLDFSYEVDGEHLVKVDFGAHYTSRDKTNNRYQTPDNINGINLIKAFQHWSDNITLTDEYVTIRRPGNIFSGATSLNADFYEVNEQALWDLVQNPETSLRLTQNGELVRAAILQNNGWTVTKKLDSFAVEEDVSSFYVDAYFSGTLADMSWNLITGLRYSDTSQSSIGRITDLASIQQEEEKDNLLLNFSTSATDEAVKNDYTNWLPSLNFNLNVSEDLVFRLAASKTIARPNLTDLAPSLTFGGATVHLRSARGSNPHLKPYLSTNFDASLEWYYSPSSLLAAAVFSKSVDDFIARTNGVETFDVELFGVDAEESWKQFDVNRPRNAESASIKGLELNWTHTLDSGFGVQSNITLVDSSAAIDVKDTTNVFAIEGLSDTANLVAFYEDGPLQARIAYNWRDEFLETAVAAYGSEPVFVDSYYQIDVSASYEINENFTVFAEGINVTGETVNKHGRFANHFVYYEDYGPRYNLGVRAKF
ncbi:TonB-dependent receptor [Bowmanella sp. Y26]|uniref:TonB-dependent receptor n=1 Tax=Bowmanella yangjiangensis TaxID=2811230 RepID=UPI001BDC39CD|nr:TonB-dependent receptor [Bowmanella yangjiangensis]MBT1063380.1 TonB-dependent receptor [Bowmanella yangjiangensis]